MDLGTIVSYSAYNTKIADGTSINFFSISRTTPVKAEMDAAVYQVQ